MNGFLNTVAQYYMTVGKGAGTGAGDGTVEGSGNWAEAGLQDYLQAASPADVFGALSQPADAAGVAASYVSGAGFSSTTLYHAVALLLLICYVAVLYRSPELLKSLRDYIFSPGSVRDQHLNDNRTNDPLRGFSWSRMLLDTLFVCTAVLRAVDLVAPQAAAVVPLSLRLLAVPAVAALFCMTLAWQTSLLAVAGTVTVSRPLTTAIGRVRAIYFRLATVVLTPVLLLWALAAGAAGRAFEGVILLGGLFIAVAFLRETFLLFMSKKLSIYHWILYLCTVEAFPLSLICLLAVRTQ